MGDVTPGGETYVSKFEKPKEQPACLDVTHEHLVNEQVLVERIRREFDQGKNPKRLRVNSSQMMELLFNSPNTYKMDTTYFYASPFGDHRIDVIPAKDLHENS